MKLEHGPTHGPDLADAYMQLRRGMLALLRQKVRDPQLAEDLLQDVFVKAVRALQAGQRVSHLPAWLHQILRTTVADHYRARGLDTESLDEEPAALPPEDDVAFQSLATCLEPLAGALPQRYREAVLAADFQGRPYAEMAQAAGGVSVSAIKSRVSRGRAMLRERLLACCAVATDGCGKVESYQIQAGAECGCQPTSAGSASPDPPPLR